MPATVGRHVGPRPDPDAVVDAMVADGLAPSRWGNAPGDTYSWHSHPYRKIVACLSGSIVFHTRDSGDAELHPGDRMTIEPDTDHAATVGPGGVECAEARVDARAGEES